MSDVSGWLRLTELDRINSLELAERIASYEARDVAVRPRRYPGYPTWRLPRPVWPGGARFDRVVRRRRCRQQLDTRLPARRTLGRLLYLAHAVQGSLDRGPTPSAGGLQALELYLVQWHIGWLPQGVYHYDRRGHYLSQLIAAASEETWGELVPSLRQIAGGALLWILVGDVARVAAKYGERAERFLLLEAGHLMQNLCLASTRLGLCTVPLGGCLEPEIADTLQLPASDAVLYAGVCGTPGRSGAPTA